MAPKACLTLLAFAFCILCVASAHAQTTPDSIRSAATVTLHDGTTHHVVWIKPSMTLQSIQVRTTDGRSEYIGFNRVRTIAGMDGKDWTHRVLVDGRKLGRDSFSDRYLEPRAGSWALGSDFRFLSGSVHVPSSTSQGSLHAGIYLSRGLEIEPAVSVVLAGYPALALETSALLHAPGGRHGHLYARGLQAEYAVTPGKEVAHAWGVGVGWETYASRTGRGRFELGYTSILEGSDVGSGNYLTVRFGFSSLKNAR